MSGLPCNNTNTTNKQGYHYWWDNVAGGGTDGGGSISSSLSKLTREESLRLEEENQKVKGSKWNAAQTFEERSYLAWAEKELNEILLRMCGDANGWKIGIKESKGDMHGWERFLLKMSVKKLTGNCSVVLSRGKMKHGLDLEATEFEMKASYMKGDLMNGEMTAVEGTFQVPEISIETIEDDEIEITERKAKEPKQPKDETEKKALKQDCEMLMKDLKMLVTDACKILLGRLAEKANE